MEGQEAKLCYAGHVLMENRNGLAVDGPVPGPQTLYMTLGAGKDALSVCLHNGRFVVLLEYNSTPRSAPLRAPTTRGCASGIAPLTFVAKTLDGRSGRRHDLLPVQSVWSCNGAYRVGKNPVFSGRPNPDGGKKSLQSIGRLMQEHFL